VRKERGILRNAKIGPFMPSSDAQLFPFQEMELNKQILKIQGDGKLGDSEKNARVAALREDIAAIRKLKEELPPK